MTQMVVMQVLGRAELFLGISSLLRTFFLPCDLCFLKNSKCLMNSHKSSLRDDSQFLENYGSNWKF